MTKTGETQPTTHQQKGGQSEGKNIQEPEEAKANVSYLAKEDGLFFVEANGDLRKLCSYLEVNAFTQGSGR